MDAVSIANLALAHIGQRSSITSLDPPEGSEHAERAAQFFPFARDTLLERHPWTFATRRETASEVAATFTGWDHVYAVPAECLAVLAVLPLNHQDDYSDTFGIAPMAFSRPLPMMAGRYVPVAFVVESLPDGTRVVLTDEPDATLRYTVRVTDTTKWSALFTEAMSHQLAAMLAGAIVKGTEGASLAKAERQMVEALLAQARVHDAGQRQVKPLHQVPWLAAR